MKNLLPYVVSFTLCLPCISNAEEPTVISNISVVRNQLGAGDPLEEKTVGKNPADYINDGYYHSPQYMAGFPTAAIIWPRIIDVDCEKIPTGITCNGYHWLPAYGRGEYLFIHPKFKASITENNPKIIYVEVPVKKKKE